MKRIGYLFSRIVIAGLLFMVGTFGLANVAYGADLVPACSDAQVANSSVCRDVGEDQDASSNKLYGPDGVLTKVAGIIAWIGGVAAVIMIILGGFTFVTGSSDPNTLSAAKKTVLYAVVGLVVMVLPSAIIRFVLSRL